MLVCYARELKEGFADYAEEVVKLMVPMLKFYFHDGVRSAAAESLPCLLDCAKIKGPQYLQGMWLYICPELIKAIDTEPENEVTVELMHSLSKVCMTKHISPTSTFLYHDFFYHIQNISVHRNTGSWMFIRRTYERYINNYK